MDSLGLLRCPIPLRLLDPEGEEEEEDNQGLDDEEFLKKLAGLCVLIKIDKEQELINYCNSF